MTTISFSDWILQNLPTFFRLPMIKAWCNILTKPIDQLKTVLNAFYTAIEYRLIWNGTVCMLEKYLNLEFDPIGNGIVIEDVAGPAQNYLFQQSEGNELVHLFQASENTPLYLYNTNEQSQFTFVIKIPSSVVFNETILRSKLKRYVLPTKKYSIEIV